MHGFTRSPFAANIEDGIVPAGDIREDTSVLGSKSVASDEFAFLLI